MAAHVSDRITDEVIESLSRSYKTLVIEMICSYDKVVRAENKRELLQIGDTDNRTRSSTPDVLRPSAGSMSSGSVIGVLAGANDPSNMSMSMTTRTGSGMASEDDSCPQSSHMLLVGSSLGQRIDHQSPMVNFSFLLFSLFTFIRHFRLTTNSLHRRCISSACLYS